MITMKKKTFCTKSLIVHFGNTKRESIRAGVTAVQLLRFAARSVSQRLPARVHLALDAEGKDREKKKGTRPKLKLALIT